MDGKPVVIGGLTFVVPDINVDAAEEVSTRLEAMADPARRRSAKDIVDVIAEVLRENYPDLNRADLAKRIKFKDAGRVMGEVLKACGLQPEEAKGEVGSP